MNEIEIFESIMNQNVVSSKQLSGGFTNLSYLIETKDNKYLLRVPGKGTNEYINRHDEVENLKILSCLPCCPKLVYGSGDSGIIITEYIDGNMPATIEDIDNPEKQYRIMDLLHRIHTSGVVLHNEFGLLKLKNNYMSILEKMDEQLPLEVVQNQQVLERTVNYLYDKYPEKLVCCHCDPKLNNFLYKGDDIYAIDWEYSGMNDAYFDLANIVMTNGLTQEQEYYIMEMYEKVSGEDIIYEKYILYKIATDYVWLYWHLIKLFQGEMVEYNEKCWKMRLYRALDNLERLGLK